jgi:hypothetical protein
MFTPTQLATLVDTFRAAGFGRHQRLAVLYRSDPHGGARAFAFIGRIQGWQVRAFDQFEDAIHWLSDDNPSPERQEKEIPVQIARRQTAVKKVPLDLPTHRRPRSSPARGRDRR